MKLLNSIFALAKIRREDLIVIKLFKINYVINQLFLN